MNSIEKHLQRHPHCRPSTLRQIQAKAEKTAQLRTELGMNEVSDRRSRFVQETESKETVLQRLIRKLRKI